MHSSKRKAMQTQEMMIKVKPKIVIADMKKHPELMNYTTFMPNIHKKAESSRRLNIKSKKALDISKGLLSMDSRVKQQNSHAHNPSPKRLKLDAKINPKKPIVFDIMIKDVRSVKNTRHHSKSRQTGLMLPNINRSVPHRTPRKNFRIPKAVHAWTAKAAAIKRSIERNKSFDSDEIKIKKSFMRAKDLSLPIYEIKKNKKPTLHDRLYLPHYINYNNSEAHCKRCYACRKIKEAIEPYKNTVKRKKGATRFQKLLRNQPKYQPINKHKRNRMNKTRKKAVPVKKLKNKGPISTVGSEYADDFEEFEMKSVIGGISKATIFRANGKCCKIKEADAAKISFRPGLLTKHRELSKRSKQRSLPPALEDKMNHMKNKYSIRRIKKV